jgi:hypothetical protein
MTSNESTGSAVIGFVLAVSNHTFGWFNTMLQVQHSQISEFTQAIITGSLGALGAFVTSRILRYAEKKIKQLKNDKESKVSTL